MLLRAFILWVVITNSAVAATKLDNLSILVNSCDKYQDLWQPFEYYLTKHWQGLNSHNKDIPIYFISNAKSPTSTRFTSIKINNETSWSDTFLIALDKINTEYVLILLEDYIFYEDVNEERLSEVFAKMQELDAAYVQVSLDDKRESGKELQDIAGMRYARKHEPWRTSLQASIWRVADLKWVLKPGENIWYFETHGSVRSEGIKAPFLRVTENHPLKYLNAAQEGLLNDRVVKYINENGSHIEPVNLKLKSDRKVKLWFKNTARKIYWNYLPSADKVKQYFRKVVG